jgi:NADPH-dependent glutamate synthase beta subunit-like oxidoreductase
LVELLAGQGDWEKAWRRIREENPLPGVCGRVCAHPCEAACNRGAYDDPIAIRSVERAAAEWARSQNLISATDVGQKAPSGFRIAVVGAGPAGLASAHFLRIMGHEVHLFDRSQEPGGLLRHAIPEYRLPLDALRWEIDLLLASGITFHPNRELGKDLGWGELTAFDATFLAIGAWSPRTLAVPGEGLARDGLALLQAVRRGDPPTVGGQVAVIGGGNTAMDVARVLVRLGAQPVLYYRRRQEDLPALPEEVREAREEGIDVQPLLAPERLVEMAGGGVRLALRPMAVGDIDSTGRASVEPSGKPLVEVDVNTVWAAIGSEPSLGLPPEATSSVAFDQVSTHLRRISPLGEWKARPPVFVGGDSVNGRRTVATAIASGKEAAVAVDAAVRRRDLELLWGKATEAADGPVSLNRLSGGDREEVSGHVIGFEDLNPAYFRHQRRRRAALLPPDERRTTYHEVRQPTASETAKREAGRCFHCGLCDQCDNCDRFCPDLSVSRPSETAGRRFDYDHCKGCGICAEECPRGVIAWVKE